MPVNEFTLWSILEHVYERQKLLTNICFERHVPWEITKQNLIFWLFCGFLDINFRLECDVNIVIAAQSQGRLLIQTPQNPKVLSISESTKRQKFAKKAKFMQ